MTNSSSRCSSGKARAKLPRKDFPIGQEGGVAFWYSSDVLHKILR